MIKINLNWKYGLTVLLLAVVCACSENDDLVQISNKQNYKVGTRTANWYTKEVTLEDIGQLEAKLAEVMNGEPLDTLEKLVISGPMGAADFNYLRSRLSYLKSLDLKDVQIKRSTEVYWHPHNGNFYLNDDSVCQNMFSHLDDLHEVVLPSATLYIGANAFYHCDSLTSITIPDGVRTLEDYTFQNCKSLSSVTLSPKLEGIGTRVFNNCHSLKSLLIPDKVEYIGNYAFSHSESLSTIELSSNSELDSLGCNVFDNTKLKSINIPDGVRYIGDNAFNCCRSLSSITLPSNLNSIEYMTFCECDSLTSITIPDKVKYIGHNAFHSCNLLSVVEFSSNSELDSIAQSAFNETEIKSIVIPDKVKYIGDYAFRYCRSLLMVTLPSNLTYLGSYAFNWCESLESIDIPDGVKQINDGTFYDCRSLKTVKLPAYLESIGTFGITASLIEEIEFPSTLKTISSWALEHNDHLTKVVIPEGVEFLGTRAFRMNRGLTELTIPSTLTTVEEDFADECYNLQTIIWNAPIDVPYNNQSNAWLFVETDQDISVNGCWANVIQNGVAEFPITIQVTGNQFNIPRDFTAAEVTYTRSFWDETVPGGSSGWQTIVLPFTPDSILHDTKGIIAPFGSDVVDAKPFWLRELTSEGFTDVTTISPDKAYIIAMPNHSDYLDEYRLNGTITFKAKDVTLAKTPEVLEPSYGPDFDFYPTYNYVKKALRIYALHSKYGNYDNKWYYKNFFTRSASDINPFNAYVTAKGGGRSSRAEFDFDTRSKATRGVPYKPNTSGIPQIGDM